MRSKVVLIGEPHTFFYALLMFILIPTISFGEQTQLVSWDKLAALEISDNNPRSDLSIRQKTDLNTVLLLQEAIKSGHYAQAEIENGSKAIKRLQAAGLSIRKLLEDEKKNSRLNSKQRDQINWNIIDTRVFIDGYILPLNGKNGTVFEFLIVPWVGACIHTPAPQSNQIIHVLYPSGLNIERQYEPFRLSGILKHRPAAHELFLIDGSRRVFASYALEESQINGTPGEIKARSVSELPISAQIRIKTNLMFTNSISSIANGYSAKSIFIAFLLAFGYGVLHTLGPGHGKTVIISYFVGTGGNLLRGLLMGVRIAVTHVFSAVIIGLALHLFFKQSFGSTPTDFYFIRLLSYTIISFIGMTMLTQTIYAYLAGKRYDMHLDGVRQTNRHRMDVHDQGTCRSCQIVNSSDNHSKFMATAVGIVPCTGALLVMLFGLANNLVIMAGMMVMAISIGMAVSMTIIGITALLGRNWAERQFGLDSIKHTQFMLFSRFVGASCIIVIGLTFLLLTIIHRPIF